MGMKMANSTSHAYTIRSLGYCKCFFTLSHFPTPNHHPVAEICSMNHVGSAAHRKRISEGAEWDVNGRTNGSFCPWFPKAMESAVVSRKEGRGS